MLHQELTKKIIGCAFTVHNTLGAGFLEKVYEQALILELTASGLSVRSQEPLSVKYRDQIVGEYYADLVVIDNLIQGCRDRGDDKFLETAVKGDAQFIISGDQDLLAMHRFEGIDIVTVQEFAVHTV